MRITDIIAAKRDGVELDARDIEQLVLGFASGEVPDYQMAAFLMAVRIRGLSFEETCAMTRAMIASGRTLDWSGVPGTKVDKHSTGGVGDKTTLVVAPVLAACGLRVPKMSGRGLGFTGGTLDKMESIPGLTTALDADRLVRQVNEVGAVIAGQTADIVPADKMMYALRDVTATVDSIPLIAASVMSKKIACGADVVLLDVKVGSGAFMKSIAGARELARTMITIGERLGRRTAAVVTDMDQPLGLAVGNALEVREALQAMQGEGPPDLRRLCTELSGLLLYIAGQCSSADEGRARAEAALSTGAALSRFEDIVRAQGGDAGCARDPSLLPTAPVTAPVLSDRSGFVSGIDAARIGVAACALGAGRVRKEDGVDPAAGVVLRYKAGDRVEAGAQLADVHGNSASSVEEARKLVLEAYVIGEAPAGRDLIHEVITDAVAAD